MLTVENLCAGYGRLPVVRDVSLAAEPGRITLLLGPNGAGKTTLLRSICGFNSVRSGSVRLGGRELTGRKPEAIAKLGLRLVLEGHRVFPDLTVEDNIRLGQLPLPAVRRMSDSEMFRRSFGVFPVLDEKRRLRARELSGGQQQMLALAQAWTAQPEVLMCDEPSLGLAELLIPDILGFLRMLADEGTAVVLVEQMAKQAMLVADEVHFLRQGELIASGAPQEFSNPDYIGRLMVGGAVESR
jgi:branched-chain amino acid transport system ATP-binding protein